MMAHGHEQFAQHQRTVHNRWNRSNRNTCRCPHRFRAVRAVVRRGTSCSILCTPFLTKCRMHPPEAPKSRRQVLHPNRSTSVWICSKTTMMTRTTMQMTARTILHDSIDRSHNPKLHGRMSLTRPRRRMIHVVHPNTDSNGNTNPCRTISLFRRSANSNQYYL